MKSKYMKVTATSFLFLLFLFVLPLFAGILSSDGPEESDNIKKEIETLKKGQVTLQNGLAEIKALLLKQQLKQQQDDDSPPSPDPKTFRVKGAPFKGNPNAKLTLVEVSDYQCPFCARHFRETLPQLETNFINTGEVKYVFHDFPLESIHKNAFKGAEAAHCSGDQGKFWEMHDKLFTTPHAMEISDLEKYARELTLDVTAFQQCLNSNKYTAEVRKDVDEGQDAGVRGTPSFFFGLTDPKSDSITVLKILRGAQSYNKFKGLIETYLK